MNSSIRSFLLVLSIFAFTVFSAPTTEKRTLTKRSFEHHVKRSIDRRNPMTGPNAMAAAYNKYGFKTSSLAKARANSTLANGLIGSNAATGNTTSSAKGSTVAALPQQNGAEYLSPVMIGNQQVTLDFDTGSSDLWVFSTALSQKTIGTHTAFNPNKSTTFKAIQGATWQISYGDGSGAKGTVGRDTVTIGGATASNQAVELATAVSQSFVQDMANDGLVGLAFSKLNTVKPQQQTTFFDTIKSQLAMPVFAADLRADNTGTYTFGAIDNTKFTGQLTSVPVDSTNGFWQVTSQSAMVGNTMINNAGGSPAIADTGTSLMLVDANVAAAYYSQVPGAQLDQTVGGYTYPCATTPPNFSVALGNNYMATIPGSGITFAQVNQNTCFGGVQSNGGAGLQIYGDVMFRAQYVVFDGGNMQLQVAPKATQ